MGAKLARQACDGTRRNCH